MIFKMFQVNVPNKIYNKYNIYNNVYNKQDKY